MTFCPCNQFTETTSGGISAGGSAVLSVEQLSGGCSLGGSATVWVIPDAYDGLTLVLPLDEHSTGEIDEFRDRTRNNLHAVGGSGDARYLTMLDDGVFCLSSQYFEGRDFINVSRDNITGEFSVSMWIKRADNKFGEKVFFSRGVQSAGHDWNFTLGTSYIGELMARIKLVGDDGNVTHLAFSSEKLQVDRWHHVAATWRPSEALELYLDGTLSGSVETPENAMVGFSSGNHSYLGRWNNGTGFVGNIQEVRLFPIGKNADYFAAEKANFCSANFVLESEVIDEAVFE
ncbi:LamG domain-containing protein [bacterium]|nr:LamG domain-containing protein [bacterium]MDB4731697.1 LamG domain-containing protein [bacterium]MDB4793032.1 LamG domain-containing protein [bacterium]